MRDTQAPLCPLCRAPIARGSIRKIICEQHSSVPPSAVNPPRSPSTEDILWKIMRNVLDRRSGHEQRKIFVHNYANETARGRSVSENFVIAFNAMRMLVGEEHASKETQRELGVARAAETRWHERATALEGELDACKSQSNISMQDAQTLRCKVQALQATFEIIHDLTSSSQSAATFSSPTSAQPRPTVQITAEPELGRNVPSPSTDHGSSPGDLQPRHPQDLFGFGERGASTRTPTPESPSTLYPRPFLSHMPSLRNHTPASPRTFFNLTPATAYSGGQRSSSSSSSSAAPPLLSLASSSEFSLNLGIRP
ncbi:hypothetical protein BDV93DRAFT_524620 [Ceratobasidium sp. AG-I]|nr:hypothetical protein BDV93DRAFT_524620 [Ceratobasidium sp. AG-I]